MKRVLTFVGALALLPTVARAHCPLCTVGAGALAVLAASLGVSSVVVGVLIGAFALALSLWLAKLPKKQYVPHQPLILGLLIFFGTIIPIAPLIVDYGPLYISLMGEYGGWLHRTYTVNLFLAGVPLGAFLVWIAPYISRKVTALRNGITMPYQGISITIALLVVASVVIQLLS